MRLDSIATTAPHLIERLERFRNFTMAHPRLVEARDELVDAIDGAAGARSCSCWARRGLARQPCG
jgi:hypothetical protein